MAQHIPIGSFRTKIFRKIEESIQRDFQNINRVKGSLKYNPDYSRFHCEHEDQEVYFTERYIGKGIVWGESRGTFEIHYNRKIRRIESIYLVA